MVNNCKPDKVQCWHLISFTTNSWAAGAWYTTARPLATQVPGHRCMDDLPTERSYNSQATWVVDVSDMLSMSFGKTRHWHASGRLVQELNVYTVYFQIQFKCSYCHKMIYILLYTSVQKVQKLFFLWLKYIFRRKSGLWMIFIVCRNIPILGVWH